MKLLLKSEFYRLFKNKGIIVTAILSLIFSILLPLFLAFLFAIIESQLSVGGINFYGIHQYCSVLAGGSLISLILFFVTTSYSCDDFKYGTIRNKVISGCSRNQIYLAKLIVNVTTGVVIQSVYAILSLIFCSIFLGYDRTNTFSINEFGNILNLLLTSIFIQITTYTLLTTLTTTLQKSNKSILFFVITLMIISVAAEIIYYVLMEFDLYKMIELLTDMNPTNQLNYIMYNELHKDLIILIIITNIIYTFIISLIGMRSFKEKELK